MLIFLKKIMGIISETIEGKNISVTVNSSNIKFAQYDTESKDLQVTFNNGLIYEYSNVPWEVFTKFRMSESQGKFFNSNISKTYKYKKIS
jgi:hypothetical protein